jgi:hypothetical protein
MATQKHMGRNELIERLTAQVGNKETAIELLKNRGHLTKDGKYTAEGMKRKQGNLRAHLSITLKLIWRN